MLASSAPSVLNKSGHANFAKRCLFGLPGVMTEADSGRVAVGFYCLGTLDIVDLLESKTTEADRAAWCAWIWEQQVHRIAARGSKGEGSENAHIGGFRPSPFMHINGDKDTSNVQAANETFEPDPPHLIMTYTALLALAILRDDFNALNRRGIVNLLRATQMDDGSFTAIPGQGEADIRMVYTAFAICEMLNDWSGVDVPSAVGFIKRCITYEGGFGQAPGNEATGGPSYCALAALALVPASSPAYEAAKLTPKEKKRALRWLAMNNVPASEDDDELEEGHTKTGVDASKDATEDVKAEVNGFRGRTGKDADVCYSFWCGGGLDILGASTLINRTPHARFLAASQYRIGGLGKSPGAHADPYHTYLGLAALALYAPPSSKAEEKVEFIGEWDASWALPRLDPLINATAETAAWAREKISGKVGSK